MNRMRKKAILLPVLLGFILGCHQGYIALWTDGAVQPETVYPYPVSCFPPEDQEALRNGIRAETAQELTRLLEDYLS